MIELICKHCGGPLTETLDGYECEYCGAVYKKKKAVPSPFNQTGQIVENQINIAGYGNAVGSDNIVKVQIG